jgi:hypothetical protein
VLFYVLFVTYHGTLLWLTGQTVDKSLFGLEVRPSHARKNVTSCYSGQSGGLVT